MYYFEKTGYEKERRETLSRLLSRKIILLDTCTILNGSFPQIMAEMEPELKCQGGCILVPDAVIQELNKLRVKKPELRRTIDVRMPQLAEWCRRGVMRVCGNRQSSGSFGDKEFLKRILHYSWRYEVLMLTQDGKLARDIEQKLGEMKSVCGHPVTVRRLNRYGNLVPFHSVSHH